MAAHHDNVAMSHIAPNPPLRRFRSALMGRLTGLFRRLLPVHLAHDQPPQLLFIAHELASLRGCQIAGVGAERVKTLLTSDSATTLRRSTLILSMIASGTPAGDRSLCCGLVSNHLSVV